VARDQRKLAAILAADVVGYSRLMGRDESGTLARLRAHRKQRLEPILARYGGRLVKLTGDGALMEFASAVDALSAAIEFQQATEDANRNQPADAAIAFRMGLHIGDLIVDGDDLYGDGVNVAARLEAAAPTGGILVSRTVHEAVAGRLKTTFEDLGELSLKNIDRPVRGYRVAWDAADWPTAADAPSKAVSGPAPTPASALASAPPALAQPDKPSIAVLPFQNMSGDAEQEYFADGMVEDVITALSRTKALFVIARNSSFAYKGKSPDIRQVGRELGVRYVLEGSVRRAGNRLRIAGQLIDATTGGHIWADRIDGGLEDIFELQDAVTSQVVGAILPALEEAEIARAKRKVGSLEAYDYYLRGLASHYRFTRESTAEALTLFQQAVELDPEFALAYANQARCYVARRSMAWDDRAHDLVEAERVSRLALSLDRSDARVLAFAGHTLRFVVGCPEEGLALLDQAVRLDPNFAIGWGWRGAARNAFGLPELAIKDLERALRLSPLDISIFLPQGQMAISHFLCDRYDEACSWAVTSLQLRPNHLTALVALMASHAMAGRLDAARRASATYLQLNPAARISNVRDRLASLFQRDEIVAKFERGLRLAGLPE
jgi:TolB-like protein/class 3 adenylate cyclase/Tfp pilus assembly protein PilF